MDPGLLYWLSNERTINIYENTEKKKKVLVMSNFSSSLHISFFFFFHTNKFSSIYNDI